MKRSMSIVAAALIALSACSKTETAPEPGKSPIASAKVTLDLSTPDKALKSYWAVRDSTHAKEFAVLSQATSQLAEAGAQLAEVAEGALAKEMVIRPGRSETYSRDIIDVKVESESRAVIIALIKNSTPIPAGAEPTKFDEERRANGDRYRYILERDKASWRVSEIWDFEGYPTKDWKKSHPTSGKPYVPSLTYGGV